MLTYVRCRSVPNSDDYLVLHRPSHADSAVLESAVVSFKSLRKRVCEPELMDDPGLDRKSHIQALRGLTRIYHASRTGATIWSVLRAEATALAGPLRVLDIATGGGDLPLDIARRANREGRHVEVHGCDLSSTAVAYARLRARRLGSAAKFFRLDISTQPIPSGYHVITAGLFLHHLASPDAVRLLRQLSKAALSTVLVDDLRRTRLGYMLAWLATRGLSRSPVVHEDGLKSVQAAFSSAEFVRLAAEAGMSDAALIQHWPERHMLIWRRRESD